MVPISIKRIFKVPIDGEKEAPPRGDDSVRSSQQQAEDKREASASKVVASLPREDGVQSSQQQAEDARDSQAEDTRDSHAESVPPPPPTANPSVVDASERSERGENDCPLCLSPLHPYDHSHPLQCPSSHCNFNCCMECLEHMIESTKDEPIEASDGNTFKVFLHCPNCRSNLGPSIRDTVLLRKVEKYMHLETNKQKVAEDLKLPASELRLKDALERDVGVASAVEGARHREDDFFGRTESEEQSFGYLDSYLGKKDSCEKTNSIWSFDSEEGVEADLSGPHKSYIFRHHGNGSDATDEPRKLTEVQADPTLLCGLDAFMTDQEQQFITAQFTSGDAGRIAAATEMMHCIAALSRQDMKPSLKRMKSCHKRTPSMKRSMLESINEVIREANEARRLEEEREARQAAGEIATAAKALQFVAISEEKRKKKREVDMEVKRQMEYMKLHPLPLRMPKYAELTSNKAESSGLSFLDDMWDGTVLDAYTKINVNTSLLGHVTITKQHGESEGIRRVIDARSRSRLAASPKSRFRRVLDATGSPKAPKSPKSIAKGIDTSPKVQQTKTVGKGYIDTEQPRVVVASINREMGQQGVVKGDVVTHFNGEDFTGTSTELAKLVENRYEGEVMTFVFNADKAVAEAMKRRSFIAEE